MKKAAAMALWVLVAAAAAWPLAAQVPLPTVDGVVSAGEYSRSIPVLDGSATLYYQADGRGGLFLAVTAPTTGWVGLGLGSAVMNGARIFMGYVKNGMGAFSEQVGDGHGHSPSATDSTAAHAVGQAGGFTTIELHIAAATLVKLSGDGKSLYYIVAFSGSPDLTTYHEDHREGGAIDLSATN